MAGESRSEVRLRPAVADDALAIAEVHLRGWQWASRGQLPDAFLDGLAATQERRVAGWRVDGATKTEERPGLTLREVRYRVRLA